ncbi:hypothetical protein U1769_01230 [Sphingomonas sp. ZT3P38]|uniref:hypothetical protein n=1 Tax=Parasphingomonas zepuensis TaxID=3096161 RepID=UPI002FC627AB
MDRRGADGRGRPPRIAIVAGCLSLSIATGMVASAYTTAGLNPFYARQRGPFYTQQRESADAAPGWAWTTDTGHESWAASTGTPESLSYPPIPTPR